MLYLAVWLDIFAIRQLRYDIDPSFDFANLPSALLYIDA